MLDLILRDARLPDGRIADLSIAGGLVRHCGAPAGPADASVSCRGMLCLPGAIDMHVHMRGGQEADKEDWRSGSESALAGGVTLVVDQPNTLPPISSVERFRERVEEARTGSRVHFGINAGVVPGAELEGMWRAGALAFGEIFTAPSTQAGALQSTLLREALQLLGRMGALATIHAERPLRAGSSTLLEHHLSRPPSGEAEMVQKLSVGLPPGARLHFCHLSCAEAVEAAVGSVEVAPHHLFLSPEQFGDQDARGKVNPPLRPQEVRERLWSRWDRIDAIASDHAPHLRREKNLPFAEAPSGIPGVETMLPLLLAHAIGGGISLGSIVEKTVLAPARILGIEPPGFSPGSRADLALYPNRKTRIDPDALHSRCGWTPYEGMEGIFPELVVLGGKIAYMEGEFHPASPRWFPGKGYSDRKTII